MGNEPYKWQLNPKACLKELGRMEDDPGYTKTICGIHRVLWSYINIEAAGHLPEPIRRRINELLEECFRMGKRMDYRLKQYFAATGGQIPDGVEWEPGNKLSERMQAEVNFPKSPTKTKQEKRSGKK